MGSEFKKTISETEVVTSTDIAGVAHLAGAETFTGTKTFSNPVWVGDGSVNNVVVMSDRIQKVTNSSPENFYFPESGGTLATIDQIPAGYSIEHIPDGATQYALQSEAITMVYVANITSNSLQLTLPDIDENTILTFELWLTVPSGATGSISYLHDGASISPEAIGSMSLSTGCKNKLVLRLINDSGTYSLEENVYFQKGL